MKKTAFNPESICKNPERNLIFTKKYAHIDTRNTQSSPHDRTSSFPWEVHKTKKAFKRKTNMKITLIRKDEEQGTEALSLCDTDAFFEKVKTENKAGLYIGTA